MAYAKIASASAAANTAATTSGIDTTGADLIVIGVSGWTSNLDTTAPTDSKGNTWTAIRYQAGGDSAVKMWYCYNPTVGSGHTFTHGGTTYATICVIAFSGAASSPLDQQNSSGSSGNVSSFAPGSITPTEDNELVVAMWATANFKSPSVDSGFTLQEYVGANALPYHGGMAYLIQTTASAANSTASWTDAYWASAVIASFKAASAASAVKTINGLARASVKTINGLAIASVKKFLGLA